jgi:hypothetical protein
MLLNEEVVGGKLTDAINKMGIPTFLSGMARGLLGRHNDLHFLQKENRRHALKNADVIILVSFPMIETWQILI